MFAQVVKFALYIRGLFLRGTFCDRIYTVQSCEITLLYAPAFPFRGAQQISITPGADTPSVRDKMPRARRTVWVCFMLCKVLSSHKEWGTYSRILRKKSQGYSHEYFDKMSIHLIFENTPTDSRHVRDRRAFARPHIWQFLVLKELNRSGFAQANRKKLLTCNTKN